MQDPRFTAISRRSLLVGLGSLALSPLLSSCAAPDPNLLRVLILRGSIPLQFVRAFQRSAAPTAIPATPASVQLDSRAQLMDLFAQLQAWKQSPPDLSPPSGWDMVRQWIPFMGARQYVPDLMTLGDSWLAPAIAQGLIQPLDPQQVKGWASLAQLPQLAQLVTRNPQGQPDPNGKIWAFPYRLGTTAIAYRKDIFAQRNLQPPTDWSDLWRADLRRRIALLDQPREVIGLTLKKLQQSYNTADLTTVPNLAQELQALNQQALYYSSTTYLQPLVLEDAWVAVGWSTDLLALAQRNHQIGVVVPASGASLFADLWVQPTMTGGRLSSSAYAWIDFCWQLDYATQLTLATLAIAPPLLVTPPVAPVPDGFRTQPALLPDPAVIQRSEFLLPLTSATTQQYRDLWTAMRSTPPTAA